jgi:hypothetical protein
MRRRGSRLIIFELFTGAHSLYVRVELKRYAPRDYTGCFEIGFYRPQSWFAPSRAVALARVLAGFFRPHDFTVPDSSRVLAWVELRGFSFLLDSELPDFS